MGRTEVAASLLLHHSATKILDAADISWPRHEPRSWGFPASIVRISRKFHLPSSCEAARFRDSGMVGNDQGPNHHLQSFTIIYTHGTLTHNSNPQTSNDHKTITLHNPHAKAHSKSPTCFLLPLSPYSYIQVAQNTTIYHTIPQYTVLYHNIPEYTIINQYHSISNHTKPS